MTERHGSQRGIANTAEAKRGNAFVRLGEKKERRAGKGLEAKAPYEVDYALGLCIPSTAERPSLHTYHGQIFFVKTRVASSR